MRLTVRAVTCMCALLLSGFCPTLGASTFILACALVAINLPMIRGAPAARIGRSAARPSARLDRCVRSLVAMRQTPLLRTLRNPSPLRPRRALRAVDRTHIPLAHQSVRRDLDIPTDTVFVDSLFAQLDANKDGSIELSEWLEHLPKGTRIRIVSKLGEEGDGSALDEYRHVRITLPMAKIIYTYTDEAPMLATYSLLPIIEVRALSRKLFERCILVLFSRSAPECATPLPARANANGVCGRTTRQPSGVGLFISVRARATGAALASSSFRARRLPVLFRRGVHALVGRRVPKVGHLGCGPHPRQLPGGADRVPAPVGRAQRAGRARQDARRQHHQAAQRLRVRPAGWSVVCRLTRERRAWGRGGARSEREKEGIGRPPSPPCTELPIAG